MAVPTIKTPLKIIGYFRPLEIVCNIFGASVTSIRQRQFIVYLSIVYTIIHAIISIGLTFYRIANIKPHFCQQSAISQSVNGIQQILGLGVVATVYYQTLFRKADVQKVLKILLKSDQELLQLNAILKYKVFGVKIVIETIFVVLYAYAAFIIFAVHYNVSDLRMLAFEFVSAINPMVLGNLVLLMFINFCWHIRNKFAKLREILENFVRHDSGHGKNDEIWTIKAKIGTSKVLFNQIQRIARIYESLFDAVNVLNRIFGLSNLTSIGNFERDHKGGKVARRDISTSFAFS